MSTASSKAKTRPVPKDNSGITWGPAAAIILVVLIYFVVQIISAQIVALYPLLKHWSAVQANNWLNNSAIAEFCYVALDEGLSVLILYWFVRWRKGRLEAIGLSKPRAVDPLYSLAGFAIYFPAYIVVVSMLSGLINGLNVNQQQAVGFSQSTTGWLLILVFLSLVVLPAIVEEILFRGFLFSGLKKALPTIWAALATSAIFASPHLLEATSGGALWIAGIDTFILSLVLCWLREKTGRLYAGMGLHALKNFIAFAALFLIHTH
jgi:membrane protease YdiL (CAAX protease family)